MSEQPQAMGPGVRTFDFDGVPMHWVPQTDGAFVGVVVGTGWLSEPLSLRGVTELTARMLVANVGLAEHVEVTAEPLTTTFIVKGPTEAVAGILERLFEGFSLPFAPQLRLPAVGGVGQMPEIFSAEQALALRRFGTSGPALEAFPKFAWYKLGEVNTERWRTSVFHRSNISIYQGSVQPWLPDVHLPRGVRPDAWTPAGELDAPIIFRTPGPGSAITLLSPRTFDFRCAMFVLGRRLGDAGQLRLLQIGPRLAYAALAGPDGANPQVSATWAEYCLVRLSDLAEKGPTADELAAYKAGAMERLARDQQGLAQARNAALATFGLSDGTDAHIVAQHLNGLSPETVGSDLRRALPSTMIGLPNPALLSIDGIEIAQDVDSGQNFGIEAEQRGPKRDEKLFATADSVTRQYMGLTSTVRFASATAVLRWENGDRQLIGLDGSTVLVSPRRWKDADGLIRMIDKRAPSSSVILMPASHEHPGPAAIKQYLNWRGAVVLGAFLLLLLALGRLVYFLSDPQVLMGGVDKLPLCSSLDPTTIDPSNKVACRSQSTEQLIRSVRVAILVAFSLVFGLRLRWFLRLVNRMFPPKPPKSQ